jgi:hypothetical protein
MSAGLKHSWLVGLVLLLMAAGPVVAQSVRSGQLGVDLEGYRFSRTFQGEDHSSRINRALSNHFLNLNLSGPVVNDNFARYSIRANIFGTYLRTKTTTSSESIYLNPDLNGLDGQILLFPTRPYGLQLYRSRSREHSLRYEANNRGLSGVLQPELSVVRRYEGDRTTTGGTLNVTFSPAAALVADVKKNELKTVRNYDFGEDRDIWISIVSDPVNPMNEQDTVTIVNSLADASVRVLILDRAGLLVEVDTVVAPRLSESIVVDSGFHFVQIIPLTLYNQYGFTVDLRAGATWTVRFTEPAAPDDRDQKTNAASLRLTLGGNGRFENRTSFDYNDSEESIKALQNSGSNLSNSARYVLSRSAGMSLMTSYNQSRSLTVGSAPQQNKSFVNTSGLTYATQGGLSTSFSHSYNWNASIADSRESTNNLHDLSNSVTLASKRLQHAISLRNSVSLLSDNLGYVSNMYAVGVSNSIETRILGARLSPRHGLRYSITRGENPDVTSKQIVTRFYIDGKIPNTKYLGDVLFKSEYSYRNRIDDVGSSSKNRYRFELNFNRDLGPRLSLRLGTGQEIESSGGSTPETGGIEGIYSAGEATEYRSSYRLGWMAIPYGQTSVNGSYAFVVSRNSKTALFDISLVGEIPYLGVPMESRFGREVRSVEGLPDQVRTVLDASASHWFRRIRMSLDFSYVREQLITATFSFHEIKANVSRYFSIF